MEFLDDEKSRNGSDAIRQNEISGKQHLFHSLAKELHTWHNTQYVLEKKLSIDRSTISESVLNGYMWKVYGDAATSASLTSLCLMSIIIFVKTHPTILSFTLGFFAYLPALLYLMYHFVFYAKIRAQVVGHVTRECYNYTSRTFYVGFAAIMFSLFVVFLFSFSFLEELAILCKLLVEKMSDSSEYKDFLISTYNFLVDILSTPDSTLGKIFNSIYFISFFFYGITAASIIYFEHIFFKKRCLEVYEEKEIEEQEKGFPLDTAMRTMTQWRKTHV